MAFENFSIAGSQVASLSIGGKAVDDLWVNGVQVATATRGITLQALKALSDSDLTLTTNLSGETVDFDLACYDQSGSKLGTVAVSGDVYPAVNLLDKIEEAGISREAMKLAGSRVELSFRQWSYYQYVDDPEYSSGTPWKLEKKVLFGIRSQTAGALQVYGNVSRSFKKCTTGICLAYMFQNNPAVKAAGLDITNMMLEPSPNFMEAAFMNCSSLDDTTPVDERGVKWPMKLYGGAQIDVFTMMLGTYYTPCARLEDAFYGTKGGYRLDLRLLSYGYSAEELQIYLPSVVNGMLSSVSNGVELHLNTDLSTLTEEQAKSLFGMSSGKVSFDLEV